MQILELLEGLRTPFLDSLFLFITKLGEKKLFITAAFVFYWCVSKRKGLYMFSVCAAGTVLNQLLKLTFRIPRPWVRYSGFKPVKQAVPGAAGYSFPSGHTQSAAGLYCSCGRMYKSKSAKTVFTVFLAAAAFSRMYLGVHTFADVFVSLLLGGGIAVLLYPVFTEKNFCLKSMRFVWGALLALSAILLCFIQFLGISDIINVKSGVKSICRNAGLVSGLWLGVEAERKFINFKSEGKFAVQLIKSVLGITMLYLVKKIACFLCGNIFSENCYYDDFLIYSAISFFGAAIWPAVFKYLYRF